MRTARTARTIPALLSGAWQWWLNQLLPPTCLLCGAAGMSGRDLCAGCSADLPRNPAACPICATPCTTPVALAASQQPCSACHVNPPPYDRTFAPFCYAYPLDFLIRQYKFGGRLSYGRLLSALFAEALLQRHVPLPDVIIPVPLHPRRLRERGFNQALELARPLARRFQIPIVAEGLQRVRYTQPQIRLNAQARQSNLLGAFALNIEPRILSAQRVALVDDVMTTTSTVSECARILRTAAVAELEIWVLARTIPNQASVL